MSGVSAAEPRLENYARFVAARRRRYERRCWSWALSALPRVRKCGRVRTDTYVGLLRGPDSAGFTGLATCGSVHACSVCNGKIQGRRAQELGAGMAAWQAEGGAFVFLTATMRHQRGNVLRDEWDALLDAWRWVSRHRSWRSRLSRLGWVGSVRATEVTDGANGWHAHIHAVLFVAGTTTPADVEDVAGHFYGLWSQALRALGGSALERGQDVRLVHNLDAAELAEYLTKTSDLHLELTSTQTKAARGRYGTRPVWTLLDEAADGNRRSLARWREWERASKGRKALNWSPGLRARLGLGVELPDDALAQDEGAVECYITPEGWDTVLTCPSLIPELLEAVQIGGESLRLWLIGERIDYAEEGEIDGVRS